MKDDKPLREIKRVCIVGGCLILPTAEGCSSFLRIAADPQEWLGPERGRRLDPLSQFALIAVERARTRAGLVLGKSSGCRPGEGVAVGSAFGAVTTAVRYARRLVSAGSASTNPIDFPDSIDGAPAAHVALECGFGGPSVTFADASSSAQSALAFAARQIAWQRASRMHLVVGDKLTEPFTTAIANDSEFASVDRDTRVRPAECVLGLVLQAFDSKVEPALENVVEVLGDFCGTTENSAGLDPDRSASPPHWQLDGNGTIRLQHTRAAERATLRDPSGALELAAAWLAAGGAATVIGAYLPEADAPIAPLVRCGKDPTLGLARIIRS